MSEMNLLKAVKDILYLWMLKNTREAASQLKKHRHGALTLQQHRVFPPFFVYSVCKLIC
jgi:hypothetical protein